MAAPEPVSLRIGPGDLVGFGRGSASVPVDLRPVNPAVSRLAGEVRVAEDHWQLSNLSASRTYLGENPEGACEPQLRDESVVAVATTSQIVERLRNQPGCERRTGVAGG